MVGQVKIRECPAGAMNRRKPFSLSIYIYIYKRERERARKTIQNRVAANIKECHIISK